MKKIYYVDCDSEFYSSLVGFLNEKCDRGFKTRKEAQAHLVYWANYIKREYANLLEKEIRNCNTLTIDLYKKVVADEDYNNNEVYNNFFDSDYELVESRYLCGRY